jgi:hypothetical protein
VSLEVSADGENWWALDRVITTPKLELPATELKWTEWLSDYEEFREVLPYIEDQDYGDVKMILGLDKEFVNGERFTYPEDGSMIRSQDGCYQVHKCALGWLATGKMKFDSGVLLSIFLSGGSCGRTVEDFQAEEELIEAANKLTEQVFCSKEEISGFGQKVRQCRSEFSVRSLDRRFKTAAKVFLMLISVFGLFGMMEEGRQDKLPTEAILESRQFGRAGVCWVQPRKWVEGVHAEAGLEKLWWFGIRKCIRLPFWAGCAKDEGFELEIFDAKWRARDEIQVCYFGVQQARIWMNFTGNDGSAMEECVTNCLPLPPQGTWGCSKRRLGKARTAQREKSTIGQAVVVREPRADIGQWKAGRIVKTVESADGRLRSALVKTKDGEVWRDIGFIVPCEDDALGRV